MLPISSPTQYSNRPHLKDGSHLHLCIPGNWDGTFLKGGTQQHVLMGRKEERKEGRKRKKREGREEIKSYGKKEQV